ncbi:serine hydrolase domain-containing protein [Streptosporangium sp. NPDC051023]|uniref:serine hydrolase domain-containing protein n=1 Tax=Streptosporangium sp. NPDC051023 TaxID=3155410 RepID=UPI00344C81CF
MQKSLAGITAVLVVALGACTAGPGSPRPERAGATGATAAAGAARCDHGLDEAFGAWARAGFSGSIAISKGGRFECLAAYGVADDVTGAPNTADTVFSIGSVTKAFTAAAVFRLVDDGRLSLDDRAGKLLTELRGPVAKATIRQLLLHTSGLNGSHGGDYEPLGRDAALAAIGRLKPAFKPGTGYVYSNAGYTLLALIVEKVSGESYRDYTASKILWLPGGHVAGGFWSGEPAAAGPRAVGYLDDGRAGRSGDFRGPYWALDGNGGLAMTARDLAAWTHALFTGQLVSRKSAEVIGSPGHDLGGGRSETPGWVAFGGSVYGTPFLSTAGGGGDVGHNAVVAWIPEQERAVAIMSNRARVTAEELLGAVGPSLLAGDPLPGPDASAVPDASAGGDDPAAIVGSYKLDTGGSFDVATADGKPVISARGADAVAALFPPRDDVTDDDLRRHEKRVLALLAGQTQEGRKERGSLEAAFGPFSGVALAGTVVSDGELRTYVTITAGRRSIVGWYAVNEQGGIKAAETPTKPPNLVFVSFGDGRYRPDDPARTGPEVTVAFEDGRMVISRAAGAGETSVARSAG